MLKLMRPADMVDSILWDVGYERYLNRITRSGSRYETMMYKVDMLRSLASGYRDVYAFAQRIEDFGALCRAKNRAVSNVTLSTVHASKGLEFDQVILIDLLEEHPEGIMLHAACVPHGILLTEYKDGQFYCADPSEYAGTGIIPIEEAWGTRVENSNAYWYVTSQVADVQEEEDLALPQVTVETSVEDLLLPLFLQDVEEETCLIGQALLAGSEDN